MSAIYSKEIQNDQYDSSSENYLTYFLNQLTTIKNYVVDNAAPLVTGAAIGAGAVLMMLDKKQKPVDHQRENRGPAHGNTGDHHSGDSGGGKGVGNTNLQAPQNILFSIDGRTFIGIDGKEQDWVELKPVDKSSSSSSSSHEPEEQHTEHRDINSNNQDQEFTSGSIISTHSVTAYNLKIKTATGGVTTISITPQKNVFRSINEVKEAIETELSAKKIVLVDTDDLVKHADYILKSDEHLNILPFTGTTHSDSDDENIFVGG